MNMFCNHYSCQYLKGHVCVDSLKLIYSNTCKKRKQSTTKLQTIHQKSERKEYSVNHEIYLLLRVSREDGGEAEKVGKVSSIRITVLLHRQGKENQPLLCVT